MKEILRRVVTFAHPLCEKCNKPVPLPEAVLIEKGGIEWPAHEECPVDDD